MRYSINFNKTVNQLVPYYLGGRKLILFLQSIVHPLQAVNTAFQTWAFEKRLEASMTSQIIKFEWFLNYKFSKYFANSAERISIMREIQVGAPFHYEGSQASGITHRITRQESETGVQDNLILYRQEENATLNNQSFIVATPAIDTTKISRTDYLALLKYQVDKYKLATKTYTIRFNNE